MAITDTLFDLIYMPTKDEQERQDNLEKIQLLLTTSAEFNKMGFKDLEINFSYSKKSVHNAIIKGNHSLLTSAIEMDKPEVVKLLIQAGMNPNDDVISSVTPLCYAAHKNHAGITEFLLQAGADIDKMKASVVLPNALSVACNYGAYDVMKVLLLNHANMQLINHKNQIAAQHIPSGNEKSMKLLDAAMTLKTAIEKLANEGDIFASTSALHTALEYDSSFVLAYLTKMAHTANLRGQGLVHNEAYYQPYLLRLAIKNIKTNINTFPDFAAIYFPEGFSELLQELNAYDTTSPNFDSNELIFKSSEEKSKTLRWFETGTGFEATKTKMQGAVLTSTPIVSALEISLAIAKSPVFTVLSQRVARNNQDSTYAEGHEVKLLKN